MNRFTRHKKLTALAIVAVLGIAGAAVAYWTSTGDGSGSATVGTSAEVTITATVAGPALTPGSDRAVSFAAANATPAIVRVGTVHLVSVAADSGHAACETDDFTMADVIEDHDVPGDATAEGLPTDGSLAYANTAVIQDPCKGATLTLTLSYS